MGKAVLKQHEYTEAQFKHHPSIAHVISYHLFEHKISTSAYEKFENDMSEKLKQLIVSKGTAIWHIAVLKNRNSNWDIDVLLSLCLSPSSEVFDHSIVFDYKNIPLQRRHLNTQKDTGTIAHLNSRQTSYSANGVQSSLMPSQNTTHLPSNSATMAVTDLTEKASASDHTKLTAGVICNDWPGWAISLDHELIQLRWIIVGSEKFVPLLKSCFHKMKLLLMARVEWKLLSKVDIIGFNGPLHELKDPLLFGMLCFWDFWKTLKLGLIFEVTKHRFGLYHKISRMFWIGLRWRFQAILLAWGPDYWQ